jgi:hypothetical protein
MTRAEALALSDELNAWCEQLGDQVWDDAHEEFRQRQGRDANGKEILAFMATTRGTGRIKAIWRQFMLMSGEEIVAGRHQV